MMRHWGRPALDSKALDKGQRVCRLQPRRGIQDCHHMLVGPQHDGDRALPGIGTESTKHRSLPIE